METKRRSARFHDETDAAPMGLNTNQFPIKTDPDMLNFFGTMNKFSLIIIVVVYLLFLLDNILLTVVVPIIPDYLFSHDANGSDLILDEQRFGPRSLSPLQRKYEMLEKDNGPVGALLASKAFVQLAFTPFIGYLTEIVGYNLPLLLGSCNLLFAALLFAYGHSYGVLVIARALHGSSSAAISVSGMCLLAKIIPNEVRSQVMPLAFGGIAMGVLIGYPFGGAAYQFIGKSAPFLLIAFFIGATIALQVKYFQKEDETEEKRFAKCSDWLMLLRNKQTLISTMAICICTSAMSILEPCVPIWLLTHLNPPPSRWQLGAVFIPDSIGYFIGSHFAGLLPVVAWRVAMISLLTVGLSCCAIPLAATMSELAFPHFGLGLGVGALDAVLVPLLANLVDSQGNHHYGPVYAIQQAAVSLAYSFGPLLGGEAVDTIGFPWLIRLIGLLNIVYCPLLLELENNKLPLLPEESLPSYSSLENSHSFDNNEWN